MKKLIILLFLSFNGFSQDCLNDITRYAEYNYMEVFNHKKQSYEKFSKVNEINATVIIDAANKMIYFTDSINNYNKKYVILTCLMGNDVLLYECTDVTNDRKCEFRFSNDKSLTVTYSCEPVIYRVKNLK